MTADNPITDLLSAPLSPDWTVDRLAEQVLCAIAARGSEEAQEFVLDAEATTDRQSRRILRPLLACLATKSAAEAGTSPNLYEGRLCVPAARSRRTGVDSRPIREQARNGAYHLRRSFLPTTEFRTKRPSGGPPSVVG